MNEFLLIFRREAAFDTQLTPEQLQEISKPWQDWMGGLAAQNKLANPGSRLNSDGKVVKPNNVVTNGAYVEVKELIGGYIVIKAASLDEAAEISKGCPILTVGGNVEVRQLIPM
ncbi:YciI family protein [Mucilaginibacter sp.]|uniref:YciI family protein n=1 Tax=Mucilaginibacter sp. TaxID=1882438 RepID=UPI002638083C|nr:YciI family protein [Mucilaginibacter sp.]MDB5029569.1 transcription initiation protein [Mucilaginibacter sp.]